VKLQPPTKKTSHDDCIVGLHKIFCQDFLIRMTYIQFRNCQLDFQFHTAFYFLLTLSCRGHDSPDDSRAGGEYWRFSGLPARQYPKRIDVSVLNQFPEFWPAPGSVDTSLIGLHPVPKTPSLVF
jgi:hypothetical protein